MIGAASLLIPVMFAAESLGTPSTLSALYEYNDPSGVCASCNNPTPTTGECSCPSGSAPSEQAPLRVLNVCADGQLHGAHIAQCQMPHGLKGVVFAHMGGSFQMDDQTPHSLGCRSPNPNTGGCSCPSDNGTVYKEQAFRVLVDTLVPGDLIGSTISFCVNSSSMSGGGMYLTDSATGACLTPNLHDECNCQSGGGDRYSPAPMEIIYPNATGAFRSATWSVCTLASSTEICPGVFAVTNGLEDVVSAVMDCINATTEFGTLLLPSGSYGVASQIAIHKPLTIGTAGVSLNDSRICGSSNNFSCVSFVALQDCCSDGGIINVLAPNVLLNHIVIDGNRDSRRGTASWNECLNNDDNRGNSVNARVSNVNNVTFLFSASINALCASGFQWQGDHCHIGYSFFANNGNHADGRWSDGLTLLSCQHGYVHDLTFVDNTDVNLVCGCGTGFLVENVEIRHNVASSFAGFMLDNFDNSQCGNYSGGAVRNVSINCALFQCDFGANFGPHPWYASSNIIGGSVSMLSVRGAKQGVNCAGAGMPNSPLSLDSINVVGPTPATNEFQCGVHETSSFNVAPDSAVTTTNCPQHTSFSWKSCP